MATTGRFSFRVIEQLGALTGSFVTRQNADDFLKKTRPGGNQA
jgi:hypothetical protein